MNIQEEIKKAQADLASAQERLDKIKVAERQRVCHECAALPWEPKGGVFYTNESGRVSECQSFNSDRLAGSEYPTREAAESALPYVTFFKRLCCLSQELNPSGKVGGNYGVYMSANRKEWITFKPMYRDSWHTFETKESALRACEIMNRDSGWKIPEL